MNQEEIKYWMRFAYSEALRSPDPSTQNGAVIVRDNVTLGRGFNEFPRGVHYTPERLERPLKYAFVEHAERNAIFDAAQDLEGSTMYALWAACSDCARAIIQSGIKELVTHSFYSNKDERPPLRKDWKASISEAFQMFQEAEVQVTFTDVSLDVTRPLRFNGQEVTF